MHEWIKNIFVLPVLSLVSLSNELFKAFNMADWSHGLNTFYKSVVEALNGAELFLEGLIYPIIGYFVLRLFHKLTGRGKSLQQMREEIDRLNDELKKHEKND